MKSSALVWIGVMMAISSFSQTRKDFMFSAHADLIKSDNTAYFEKLQASSEVNYFLHERITATGGLEYRTDDRKMSVVVGGRWFPIPEAFIRMRGLIGANELSVGGGWAMPLNDKWKFEAMGDVYTGGNIAIRAGFAYILHVK